MSIDIISTGRYASDHILNNDMLSKMVDTNSQWIVERTGILERRISEDKTTEEMAQMACERAVKKVAELNGIDVSDMMSKIELIVFATVSGDTKTPASSFRLSEKLGIRECTCLDVNAACSGFLYAMTVAKSMMKELNKKYALVVGAERLSKYVDWDDRGTCILFGDGAGAALLENTQDMSGDGECSCENRLEICDIYLGGRVDDKGLLTLHSKNHIDEENNRFIGMNGRQVYKFATEIGPKVIEKLFDKTGLTKDDIKFVVPHQANVRIIKTMAQKSGIELDKWYTNIEKYGNTSAASVPMALDEALEKWSDVLKASSCKTGENGEKTDQYDEGSDRAKYILSIAFGGGLSYAGILFKIK